MSFTQLAPEKTIVKVVTNLQERGFLPFVVQNREEALAKVIDLIPKGETVMNGSSITLEEIGFTDYLKAGKHGWKNLHEEVFKEKDFVKQLDLRRKATLAHYYIGSVHALTEEGEMVIASGSGSQLPHLVYNSPNIILVVSTQKITPNISVALERLEKHVMPLENEKMLTRLGVGTMKAKTLILHRENPRYGRKIHILLVKEKLGY